MSYSENDLETEAEEGNANIILLDTFLQEYRGDLLQAVKVQNPPIYQGVPCQLRTSIMENMKRKPFAAQQVAVQAISQILRLYPYPPASSRSIH